MKIALISEHASPLAPLGGTDSGGQNVYVAKISRQLARFGHQVDVFTRRDSPHLQPIVPFENNVHVIHVPAGPERFVPKEELLPHMDEFAAWITAYCAPPWARYDLVHANFFMSGLTALALKREYGTPFVITFHALGKVRRLHQGDADAFPVKRLAIEEELVARADRIVAECPQDREDVIDLYGADPQRVEVVPCGFDPEELGPGRSALRGEFGLDDKDFVVLQLGRLVPRKGIDNVIRAVAELKRGHGIDARLLVVGGESPEPDPALTPEIGRLSQIARGAGVAGQVIFTGQRPRDRLRDFYCAADAFVTTPWYEPFGITPLEAMACGCPVIGSAVGGIRYTVIDSVTGYLVPPNDPVQLAERLARLHNNPALSRAFGRAGILRVRSAFTWRRVTAQLARVYASVINLRGLRRAARMART
ncbi:MAG: putative glycosyl transferase [Rhodocyclaceae bacterium]|nr:putative glycosyl transferase [Rhodocyclaceae bacterium]